MTHNTFAILDEDYHLKYKEEQEMKKTLQESKKIFDKKKQKTKRNK